MRKAANTYSDRVQNARPQQRRPAIRRRAKAKTVGPGSRRRWLVIGIPIAITVMLCLTINFRAFSELKKEANQNADLESQIQSVTNENLGLQEEIHYLKNDSTTIEREARKFGLSRPQEKKVSVPAK